jgi:hypothetical protein
VVRPLPDDRLDGFQADFSLLLGARFANPDDAAALGAGGLLIEDKFDHFAAPKVETTAQPEFFFRGIQDEAWESLRLASRLITRLARLFDTTRFEPRALARGKLGILSTPALQVVMVRQE